MTHIIHDIAYIISVLYCDKKILQERKGLFWFMVSEISIYGHLARCFGSVVRLNIVVMSMWWGKAAYMVASGETRKISPSKAHSDFLTVGPTS